MDVDELQHALGGVVLESAYMERVLRAAFSALVTSVCRNVEGARDMGLLDLELHIARY